MKFSNKGKIGFSFCLGVIFESAKLFPYNWVAFCIYILLLAISED